MLLELSLGVGILLLLTYSTSSLFLSNLKILGTSMARVERRTHTNAALGVVASWVNRAGAVDIFDSQTSGSPVSSGDFLRLTIGGEVAWVRIDSTGLVLIPSDGSEILLSARIKRPLSGNAFTRLVPMSPWVDFRDGEPLVYVDPYAKSGLVVVRFVPEGGAQTLSQGLVNLGF